MEVLIWFLIAIGAFICARSESSDKSKLNKKIEEIKNATDYIDKVDTMYETKIYALCGIDFFMFWKTSESIISRDISTEQEDMLIKIKVLKPEDDIRLLSDEELVNAMLEWTKVVAARLLSKNQMSEGEVVKTIERWTKARGLISITRTHVLETYIHQITSVLKSFVEEEKHTIQSCDYTLKEIKEILNNAENYIDKELTSIKEKYIVSKENN